VSTNRNLEQIKQRRKQEEEYWKQLRHIASKDEIVEFYKLYVKYLEWNDIISPDRQAIHKMAVKVIELIEKVD